jgi:hypothetical protein
LYTKSDHEGKILIVFLYVDDMIYIGNMMLEEFKHAMKIEFEMNDLELMKYFLGIESCTIVSWYSFLSTKVCYRHSKKV